MTARRRAPRGSPPGTPPDAPPMGETFADLVSGSGGLPGPDIRKLAKRNERARGRKPVRHERASASDARFHHPEPEEPLLGHAEGIATSQLRRLRGGEIRPEVEIDLHALRAEPARRRLVAELSRAAAGGIRCVIVIHGKGLRSAEVPVLRTSLPAWLASAALGGCVLAYAPAQPGDGGRGATYVLLRRTRE